jgi:hypothetical protein
MNYDEIKNKIEDKIHTTRRPVLSKYTKEYIDYLYHLFFRAANTNGFNHLCTILRVEGIKCGHWDSLLEAKETGDDMSKLLRSAGRWRKKKRALRLGLFLYCHLTEMSAPYEVIANLLRGCQDQLYKVYPFEHLIRVHNKKDFFSKRHLPSPKQKIKHIEELALRCGEEKINKTISGFFRNDIRNAFYHSDYTIENDEFRIIEGSTIGQEVIKLDDLSNYLTKCFAFYSAFFIVFENIKKELVKGKKFHRWSNYEVLELLSDKNELTGFKIHFPNNSYAMFERKGYEGTMSMNISCEKEGVSLFVGDINKYKEAEDWHVGGKPFIEFGTRYNNYGYWKPIIFCGDSDKITKKITGLTDDKINQGCLFYVFATGHSAIEFALKSKRRLFGSKKEYSVPFFAKEKNVVIKECGFYNDFYLYDGTYFINDKTPESIDKGLKWIENFIQSQSKNNQDISYRLKYQIYQDVSSGAKKENDDSSFSISFSTDDPRNTMVATDLRIFPKSDWKIREEWI